MDVNREESPGPRPKELQRVQRLKGGEETEGGVASEVERNEGGRGGEGGNRPLNRMLPRR